MILLPGAEQKRYDKLGGKQTNPHKGVLHTTEGGGLPDYRGGKDAPNLTAQWDPKTKTGKVWQHFGLDIASRSLVNLAGGVETNNDGTLQIELVGTCDPAMRGKLFYWPEADQDALNWLAGLLREIESLTAIPRVATSRPWVGYPQSYGNSSARMSFAEWTAFRGWCGHQHVPENDHGDPGKLDVAYLIGVSAVPGLPATPVFPSLGSSGGEVTALQTRLIELGYVLHDGADGVFGPETDAAVRVLQGAAGISVDGVVGPATQAALASGVRPGVGTPAPVEIVRPPYELLDTDGELGPKTIFRWQQVMGTPADGVISKPSELIRAVQGRCGVATDGLLGPITIAALQRHLGTPADGRLDHPSACIRALQARLNANQF